MAYDSDAMEDMLDMDMVSNFISAAMLLKELDSIMDDIIACWAEDEKEDDSSIVCISFFIIMDELMDDDDSLWLIIIDPDEGKDGNGKYVNLQYDFKDNAMSEFILITIKLD